MVNDKSKLNEPDEPGIPPIIASGGMELLPKFKTPFNERSFNTNLSIIAVFLTYKLPFKLASPDWTNKWLLRNVKLPPLTSKNPLIYIWRYLLELLDASNQLLIIYIKSIYL